MMITKSSEIEIWPLGVCTVALYYGVICVLHRGYVLKYVVKYMVTTCMYVCMYVNLATDFYIYKVEAYVLRCRHLTQNCFLQ
jgi:hypothetical protein